MCALGAVGSMPEYRVTGPASRSRRSASRSVLWAIRPRQARSSRMCGAVTGPLCLVPCPTVRHATSRAPRGRGASRLVRGDGPRPRDPQPPRPLLPGRDPDPGAGAHGRVGDPLPRLEPDRRRRVEDVDAVLLAADAEQGAQPGGAARQLGVATPRRRAGARARRPGRRAPPPRAAARRRGARRRARRRSRRSACRRRSRRRGGPPGPTSPRCGRCGPGSSASRGRPRPGRPRPRRRGPAPRRRRCRRPARTRAAPGPRRAGRRPARRGPAGSGWLTGGGSGPSTRGPR